MSYTKETRDLAARFIETMMHLAKMAEYKVPVDVDNLNVTQLRCLVLIQDNPGITQKELAERLEITPASVSVAMRHLVKMGLVERHPSETDGRIMNLFLGPRGQKMVHDTQNIRIEVFSDVLSNLPIEDQRMMVEAMERAVASKQRKMLLESEEESEAV